MRTISKGQREYKAVEVDKRPRLTPALFEEQVGRAMDENGRYLLFVISSGTVDRDGDTIALDGWDTKTWRKERGVLAFHDHRRPIASGLALWHDERYMYSIADYPSRDLDPFAFSMYELASKGYPPKSASVGFIATKWEARYEEGKEDGWPIGYDFLKQELVEWSQVVAGSNRDTTVLSSQLGEAKAAGIDIDPLMKYMEERIETATAAEVAKGMLPKALCEEVRGALCTRTVTGPSGPAPSVGRKTYRMKLSTFMRFIRRLSHG